MPTTITVTTAEVTDITAAMPNYIANTITAKVTDITAAIPALITNTITAGAADTGAATNSIALTSDSSYITETKEFYSIDLATLITEENYV